MKVNFNEAKRLLKELSHLKIPILLVGPSGVGKTTLVHELAQEMAFECLDIRLSRELPEHLGGIPIPDEKSKTFKKCLYERLKRVFETRTFLFFDEFNRSHIWQRNSVMSLFYERRLDEYNLHDDSLLVLAINYGENYQVEDIDFAILARCAVINIEPDVSSFIEFINEKYPDVSHFVLPKIEEIFEKVHKENVEILPARTTRNLEFALMVLRHSYQNRLPYDFTKKLLLTVVPPDIAEMIMLNINYELILKILSGDWKKDKTVQKITDEEIIPIISYLRFKKYKNEIEMTNVLEFLYNYYDKKQLKDSLVVFIKLMNSIPDNKNLFLSLYRKLPDTNPVKKFIDEVIFEVAKEET